MKPKEKVNHQLNELYEFKVEDKLVDYEDEEWGDNDGQSDDDEYDRYMRLTVKDKFQ